jgi:hypothetical protein
MTQLAFSPSTRAFYDPASWPHDLPSDIVLISTGDHARLLGELSEGRVLDVDADGYPVTTEPAGPDIEQLAHLARQRRDAGISAVQWLIQRHGDELAVSRPTTLNEAEHLQLLQYVQDLRDVPAQTGFPTEIVWPVTPDVAAI